MIKLVAAMATNPSLEHLRILNKMGEQDPGLLSSDQHWTQLQQYCDRNRLERETRDRVVEDVVEGAGMPVHEALYLLANDRNEHAGRAATRRVVQSRFVDITEFTDGPSTF